MAKKIYLNFRKGEQKMNSRTYVDFLTLDILKKNDVSKTKPTNKLGKRSAIKKNIINLPYMDGYFPGNNIKNSFENITYKKDDLKPKIVNGFIPKDIVEKINNESGYFAKDGVYMLDGVYFVKKSIPPFAGNKNLTEVKAENNIISFGKYDYFKYVSNDGKEYCMHNGKTGFGVTQTELMRDTVYDNQAFRYIAFWNSMMTITGSDLPGKEYSRDEVITYLKDAGIKPGFFTINMKERSKTLFYSQNKYARIVIRKSDYDANYNSYTKESHMLNSFEPGSIFKIGEKEYVLSENHTLDIPYGEDIYNMEYPKHEK